ncbi:MAG: hypothetical protein KF845_06000 [Cyclobacteriaceae bacterium]|nr:hypothetical protein [Cyclobacteriaceae bacterium]
MKKTLILIAAVFTAALTYAQSEIQTVFNSSRVTAYGALTNKFTSIRGDFANMTGMYGGVFINRKVMLGVGGFATTNRISVPTEFSEFPGNSLSYGYVQTGFMTEYVVRSNKAVHLVLSMFAGAGFSYQYEHWTNPDYDWLEIEGIYDQRWSFVMEPGAQVEINLLRWMRFSPGISYRSVHNSNGRGLSDKNLSDWSYNVTLKFGKF